MFSRTSRLNLKPVVLRIFRVLHTVQFSRFVVVSSQQQLVYLITTRCICQQLFSFIWKFFLFLTFLTFSDASDFITFFLLCQALFRTFCSFLRLFVFFWCPVAQGEYYNSKAFYKSQLLFSIFSIFFLFRVNAEVISASVPSVHQTVSPPGPEKEVFCRPSPD